LNGAMGRAEGKYEWRVTDKGRQWRFHSVRIKEGRLFLARVKKKKGSMSEKDLDE